jgi:hypothetical protein
MARLFFRRRIKRAFAHPIHPPQRINQTLHRGLDEWTEGVDPAVPRQHQARVEQARCFFDCVQRREQKYPRLCGVRAVISRPARVNDWPQVVQTSITSPWRRHSGTVSGSVCWPRFSLE